MSGVGWSVLLRSVSARSRLFCILSAASHPRSTQPCQMHRKDPECRLPVCTPAKEPLLQRAPSFNHGPSGRCLGILSICVIRLQLRFSRLVLLQMSDLQRKDLSPAWKATKPFLNGGLSGMAATCIIQPIDMVKVRIQIGAKGGPVSTLLLSIRFYPKAATTCLAFQQLFCCVRTLCHTRCKRYVPGLQVFTDFPTKALIIL